MGRPERILRFVLLALLWSAWLALRAGWILLGWLLSREGRTWCGKWASGLVLVACIALLPKAAGLLWGRMMLRDAAEISATQSEGRDLADIEAALRRRAFVLGFTDIAFQDEAVRVERQTEAEGSTCAIEMDFMQRVNLYGWAEPRVRIHLKVEKPVFPKAAVPNLQDLIS